MEENKKEIDIQQVEPDAKEQAETAQELDNKRVEQLEKENAVLKQNAAAAAKAPVRGVSVGAGQSAPASDFEKGLFSDPW